MSPVGFETTISPGERPQTHALDGAANGIQIPPLKYEIILLLLLLKNILQM